MISHSIHCITVLVVTYCPRHTQWVYFVCTYPGAPWIRLPDATPICIAAARAVCDGGDDV